MIGAFCAHHIICLNIGFWYGIFLWKWCVFNRSAFNKKRYSSFLKKVFVFQKICFEVKLLKTFKILTYCHIKTCRSLKLFWKFLVAFFRRTEALSVGFKMKPLRKSVSSFKTKTSPNLVVKLAGKSNHSFFVYLINHIFQTSVT